MSKATRAVVVAVSVLAVLGLAAAVFSAWRQGRPRPTVTALEPPAVIGTSPAVLRLDVRAPTGKLANVRVLVTQAGDKPTLSASEHPEVAGRSEAVIEIPLDAKALALGEGDVDVTVVATDDAWRPRPDQAPQLVQSFRVDVTPPSLQFVSATRYVKRSGSAVAVYRVEGASASGVKIGDARFPGRAGLSSDASVHVALFALPWSEEQAQPSLWAEDEAGNFRNASFPVEFLPSQRGTDEIKLTAGFLQRKVPELDPQTPGDATTEQLLERFLKINGEMRRANEATIATAASGPSAERPLWSGAFRQQPNSKVFAGFPERRTYMMDGRTVDEQWHLGLDLASNEHSPVLASGAGRVVHAGDNGIYGNMVVLDHGLGLHSLYGHLSTLEVKVGDDVAQGAELGRSGETGMAGGDHLHFAMLVSGTYVNPVEWWDAAWIRDRFAKPLVEAGISVPGVTDGALGAAAGSGAPRKSSGATKRSSSRTRGRG